MATAASTPAAAPPAQRRLRRGAREWSADRGVLAGLLLAAPMLILLAALLIYPLYKLGAMALGAPHGLGNVKAFFQESANTRVLRITFVDSAIVTVLCVLIGSVVAWSLRTTTSRVAKALLWSAMIVPFLMGSVLKLYAFTVMLQTNGVVNKGLQAIGIIDQPLNLLYNQFAVVVGLTYQMLPFAVLPLLAGFQSIEPDLVRAAESLGAGRMRALASTVVPLAIPSLLATATVVYVITLGFFLVPAVLGGPSTPFTSALVYQDVFQFYDTTTAAVSSLVLLAGSLLVIGVSYLIVGRERLSRAVVQ